MYVSMCVCVCVCGRVCVCVVYVCIFSNCHFLGKIVTIIGIDG